MGRVSTYYMQHNRIAAGLTARIPTASVQCHSACNSCRRSACSNNLNNDSRAMEHAYHPRETPTSSRKRACRQPAHRLHSAHTHCQDTRVDTATRAVRRTGGEAHAPSPTSRFSALMVMDHDGQPEALSPAISISISQRPPRSAKHAHADLLSTYIHTVRCSR